jgi:hypothetical protein
MRYQVKRTFKYFFVEFGHMKFKTFITESSIHDQMNDAERINDPVDKAIAKYVLDPMYSYEVDLIIEKGIKKYPNTDAVKLYRGINFRTKEEFEKFMSDLDDGKVKFKSSTSWSPKKQVAEQFAKSRPSYMEFMSRDSWDEISKQSKAKERITGYRGIIISTEIGKDEALDLSRTKYQAEPEMILPPGTYKLDIEQVKSFKDILSDSDVNTEIAKMTKEKKTDRDQEKFLEFIWAHHKEQFNDESKAKVFQLMAFRPFYYEIEFRKADKLFYKHDTIKVDTNARHVTILDSMSNFLLDKDVEKIKSASRSSFKKMLVDVKKLYKEGAVISWEDIGDVADFLGLKTEYINLLKSTIGKTYNDTTTREHNRKINTHDAIKKETERLVALLNSIK